MKNKQHLFSITKKDFDIQFSRGTGPGGQNRNKRDTAVRIIHKESSAVGEAKEERSQHQNKIMAFRRLVNNKTFQSWLRIKTSEASGLLDNIDEVVDKQMNIKNLKIETKENGKWTKVNSEKELEDG